MSTPTHDTISLTPLADEANWSYQRGGVPAAEPMAMAALALAAQDHVDAAERARQKLAGLQAADGSLGVTADQPTPQWPTGWAVLAWASAGGQRYQKNIDRAIDWILSQHGHTWQRAEKLGHDTSLDGWPWVAGTHPWIEPTAINVLALKAAGHAQHPRTREAVALLIDRLLPQGGCNYGNTSVFGRVLRPHLEPSGLTLVALAGESDDAQRIEKTLEYVQRSISPRASGVSLAYGLLGLTAHGRRPPQANQWIAEAATRAKSSFTRRMNVLSPSEKRHDVIDSPLRRAALALAACERCPFLLAAIENEMVS